MRVSSSLIVVWLAVCAPGAFAQAPVVPGAAPQSDCSGQKSFKGELATQSNYIKLVGQVEVECPGDIKFYADDYIEIFTEQKKVVAVGNVVFTQGGTRISGERAEFNYATRLGTFHKASGIASLGPKADRSMFGTLEPDIYFYGAKLEKIATDKYRITRGAFTTCVQPTPRWTFVSSEATIRLEHYAILKNSLLKVKSVPVFYLPIMYYPVKKDDRATGFLIPTYGTSSAQGQKISNAFFWAINRSQDATVLHDWYSRTGQGFGGEYRYVRGTGSAGDFRTYFLKEHAAEFRLPSSTQVFRTPDRQSYELHGNATQAFGKYVRASERIDYFSDVSVRQTYYDDINQSSQTSRSWGASVSASRGLYSVAGAVERAEYFINGTQRSALTGSTPRINAQQAERPLGATRIYVGASGDYGRRTLQNFESGIVDRSSTRINAVPTIRFPFTRWPFLTVNSSAAWHFTRWSQSVDDGEIVNVPLARRYFEVQSRITGPVFTRIWNTPGNGYAEKFKHMVEPTFTVQRVSAAGDLATVPQVDAVDLVIGDTTRLAYGVNNRFYAKTRGGPEAQRSREFASVSVFQTYYSNALSSRYDFSYRSTLSGRKPSNFSPIALGGRFSPNDSTSASVQTEYDADIGSFRGFTAGGSYAAGEWLRTSGTWTRGQRTGERVDQYFNSTTTARFSGNKYGGMFSLYYDLYRKTLLQRRMIGYYNAQCCGFTLEYSMFDYTALGSRALVAKDTRLNIGFTLAGIGSFSNFFGALGGAQR